MDVFIGFTQWEPWQKYKNVNLFFDKRINNYKNVRTRTCMFVRAFALQMFHFRFDMNVCNENYMLQTLQTLQFIQFFFFVFVLRINDVHSIVYSHRI